MTFQINNQLSVCIMFSVPVETHTNVLSRKYQFLISMQELET